MFLLFALPSVMFAAEDNSNKEANGIDKQLIEKAEIPEYVLTTMTTHEKKELLKKIKDGAKITFESREVHEYKRNANGDLEEVVNDGIIAYGTIPATDLSLWFDVFNVYYSGTNYKNIRANYQWKSVESVEGDSIGISIDDGWRMRDGSLSCAEYGRRSAYDPWVYGGNCSGRPADTSKYGASWTLDDLLYKGVAQMDIYKISSSANPQVYGKYAETLSSSYSYGASFGPLSISYSPSSYVNTAGWFKTF